MSRFLVPVRFGCDFDLHWAPAGGPNDLKMHLKDHEKRGSNVGRFCDRFLGRFLVILGAMLALLQPHFRSQGTCSSPKSRKNSGGLAVVWP